MRGKSRSRRTEKGSHRNVNGTVAFTPVPLELFLSYCKSSMKGQRPVPAPNGQLEGQIQLIQTLCCKNSSKGRNSKGRCCAYTELKASGGRRVI